MSRISALYSRLLMSLYKKEAAYDAGVTINSTNACELIGHDSEPPKFSDKTESDLKLITGSEWPTHQEIVRQAVEFDYVEPKAKPNSLAGMAALVLGSIASTKDGLSNAWRHLITPIAAATPLPSIQVEWLDATQWKYTGIVGKDLKLFAKEDGFVQLSASMVGSGSRSPSANAFPNKVAESWLKTTVMKTWMESGANISIRATPVQASQDISSGTPTDLRVRMSAFSFEWNNNNFLNFGFGSPTLLENDKGAMRTAKLTFTLWFQDDTELNLYLNQTAVSIEIDVKGATLIDPAGSMYPGFDLVVPMGQLMPIGKKGKAGEFITQDFDVTIMNDGSHPVVQLYVYNGVAAYLA